MLDKTVPVRTPYIAPAVRDDPERASVGDRRDEEVALLHRDDDLVDFTERETARRALGQAGHAGDDRRELFCAGPFERARRRHEQSVGRHRDRVGHTRRRADEARQQPIEIADLGTGDHRAGSI